MSSIELEAPYLQSLNEDPDVIYSVTRPFATEKGIYNWTTGAGYLVSKLVSRVNLTKAEEETIEDGVAALSISAFKLASSASELGYFSRKYRKDSVIDYGFSRDLAKIILNGVRRTRRQTAPHFR